MLYTAAPSTWPTGSKPTLRIAANSSEVSAEPHVPLRRISCIRASAAGGRCSLTPSAYLSCASHSSFLRWTVSSAQAASSGVEKGPSRSLPGVGPSSSSTVWRVRLYHHRFSLSMHLRLAKHGDSASSGPAFTHPPGSRGYPAAGVRGQEEPQDRGAGRQDARDHRADAGGRPAGGPGA